MIRDLEDMERLTDLVGCDVPVLGFNEPNNEEPAGSDMTLPTLVFAWRELQHQLSGEFLVSPAMCPPDSCVRHDYYLMDFIDACQGCRWERLAIHYYGYTDPIDSFYRFKDYYEGLIAELEERYLGWPIWITELGYWGNEFDAALFLSMVLDYAEDDGRIEYINWFKVGPTDWPGLAALYQPDGDLSAVGSVWRSY
jgi:hypothetical protein